MPGNPLNRFYDDQIQNINTVSKHPSVEAIYVPLEYMPNFRSYEEFLLSDSSGWDFNREDSDLMELIRFYSTYNHPSLQSVPAFGLTDGHMFELQGFAIHNSRRKNQYKNIMFDWDYVINLRDGFSAPLDLDEFYQTFNQDFSNLKITPTTLLKFMIGSKHRLEMIRDTIRICRTYGFKTHIVTSNSGCPTSVFKEVVRALDPKVETHCSASDKFGGNKLLCMIDHNLLPPFTPTPPPSPRNVSAFGKSMKKHGFLMYKS